MSHSGAFSELGNALLMAMAKAQESKKKHMIFLKA